DVVKLSPASSLPAIDQLVDPQIVILKQVAAFGDVRHEDVEVAAVVDVAKRDGHPALRLALEAGGDEPEALPVVVDVQLFGPIIVGEIDVGPAVLVEIRGRSRQRPSRAAQSEL